jgi:hypothetical protein
MKKIEFKVVTISLIALGLNLLLVPSSNFFVGISFSILTMIYTYLGIVLFNDIDPSNILKKDSYKDIDRLRILGSILTGIAFGVTTYGIKLKFLSRPGADFNLIAGLISLLIIVTIGVIKYSKTKSEYYTFIFKRAIIFGGLATILTFLPKTTWIEFKFRNHPTYVEALKEAIDNPDNKDLWKKVEEERSKIDE